MNWDIVVCPVSLAPLFSSYTVCLPCKSFRLSLKSSLQCPVMPVFVCFKQYICCFLPQQDVASEGESTDEEIDARTFSGRKCSSVPIEETGIELQTVKCHRFESEEVDKGINYSLSRSQVLFYS